MVSYVVARKKSLESLSLCASDEYGDLRILVIYLSMAVSGLEQQGLDPHAPIAVWTDNAELLGLLGPNPNPSDRAHLPRGADTIQSMRQQRELLGVAATAADLFAARTGGDRQFVASGA